MTVGRWGERATALAVVLILPMAIRVRPLREVLVWCDRVPVRARRRASPAALAQRSRRWLAYGRGPWTSNCLTRSLVLYAMLKQHGYHPSLEIGIAGTERRFEAHAWVTVNGAPVCEPPQVAHTYARLVSHDA